MTTNQANERGALIRNFLDRVASGQGPGITVRHQVDPASKIPWPAIIGGSAVIVAALIALKK